MSEILLFGLIGLAALAVLGLGIRVIIKFKSGNKTTFKNINAAGDVVGRDKK
jgi:hypothetical protein